MVNAPLARKPQQLQLQNDKKPWHEKLPPSRPVKTKVTLMLHHVYVAGWLDSGVQLKDLTTFFASVVPNKRLYKDLTHGLALEYLHHRLFCAGAKDSLSWQL